GRVDSDHGVPWHAAERREIFARECAIRVVLVPVPRIGENEPLRGFQSERMDVVDEDQEPRELLATLHNAEFRCLLDRIDGVAARIGKADDFRFRRLRLQQERREIGTWKRVAHLPKHLTAALYHYRFGIA